MQQGCLSSGRGHGHSRYSSACLPLGMSETGNPTTSGCSSWLSPGKFDRPMMCGLVEVRNETSHGWEGGEYVFGINTFRGHPVMGQSCTPLVHHCRKAGFLSLARVLCCPKSEIVLHNPCCGISHLHLAWRRG